MKPNKGTNIRAIGPAMGATANYTTMENNFTPDNKDNFQKSLEEYNESKLNHVDTDLLAGYHNGTEVGEEVICFVVQEKVHKKGIITNIVNTNDGTLNIVKVINDIAVE